MIRLLFLALGPAVALATACAGPGGTAKVPAYGDLGSSIVLKEGTIYTPAGRGSHGCLLYSVRVPGGQAPTALMYRSVDGRFGYRRPEQCVEVPKARQ
ncbi:MAG: hypothetical protein OXH92_16505 [Bryobacterales bacterium]|nr:hypothetical protein [Bryobacterales bacterium]